MSRKCLSAVLTACFALSLLIPVGAEASGTAPVQVSLTSNHNPSTRGQSVTFTAKVTPQVKGAFTPEGAVAFVDGTTPLGVANLNASGVAKLSTKVLAAGVHELAAEYGGDGYFGPSDSPVLLQVVQKATTELTLKSSRDPAPYGAAITLTAILKVLPPGSGTPTGSIVVLEDGSPVASLPLEGKKVVTYSLRGHPPGTDEFQAIYAGDADSEASESAVLTQTIAKAATEVTLKSSRNPSVASTSVTLTATVKVLAPGAGIPTGDVVVLEDGLPVATLPLPEGKRVAKLSLKGHSAGIFGFVAAYSGDANYTASQSPLLVQLIAPYAPKVTTIDPANGPEPGGTAVSIEGQNLAYATEVKFGSTPAQSFEVTSPTTMEAVSPPGSGVVDVTVTTPGGVSASSSSDRFSYLPPPSVTGVSPSGGPEGGGTVVTITGTDFAGATAVTFASFKFGDAEAQSFKAISPTLIEAVSPASTGAADIVVTTPNGISDRTSADRFSYMPPAPVTAYDNYGPATLGHAMCRGNPARPESMPGGTATQTFTVPSGVASLSSATVQIDPDTTVTAHLTLKINGTTRATASAAAVGDTKFSWPPVAVQAGDSASLSIAFTATFGKIITVYSAAAVGGTLTYSNSCSDGAPSGTTPNGLRAVVSGLSP